MNKIISINLKGIIFQVEEEAFDRLKQYLETLNRHFAKDESRLEIIDDIESRLAEMMQEKLKIKAAITMADVEEIIGIMGQPADFDTENTETNEEAEPKATSSTYSNAYTEPTAKRFFRDTENSMLGGVCAGAGHYFGVDPLWVRLGFLFLFFVMGTGLLFYVILWVIIPEAKTQSDRLRMKGEPVNVDNIEKAVKEEYERVKKNFDEYSKTKGGKLTRGISRSLGIAGDIILAFAKFIAKVVGIFVLVMAVLFFIAFVSITIHLVFNGTLPVLSLAFDTAGAFWLTAISVIVLLLMVVVAFIQLALKLFNPHSKLFSNKGYRWFTASITTLSIVVLIIMGIMFGRSFSEKQLVVSTVLINEGDTLTVSAYNPVYNRVFGEYDAGKTYDYNSRNFKFDNLDFSFVRNSKNSILNDSLWHTARFEVERSAKDIWELEIIRTSYGTDDYMAKMFAEKIPLDYNVSNGKLTINTHFYAGDNIPFRDQKITYRLWVPQGKVVKFDQGLTEIMNYGLKSRVTDPESYGMTWAMSENGLRCLDCRKMAKGSIPADARRYGVSDFTSVEIDVPAKVQIINSPDYEVAIMGPDRVRENLEVKTHGNRLTIQFDKGLFDIFDGFDVSDLQIIIKTPVLKSIEANGAARVEFEKFTSSTMEISLSGASSAEGRVEADELSLELSGSSLVELAGTAGAVKAELSGASKIKAYGLFAKTYSVDMSGATKAEVAASQQITGDLSGASLVTYNGSPLVKVSTSGASAVKRGE
jgi:phage shock protein PspC (stress-responsive transcriptional regulator)